MVLDGCTTRPNIDRTTISLTKISFNICSQESTETLEDLATGGAEEADSDGSCEPDLELQELCKEVRLKLAQALFIGIETPASC